MIDLWLVLALLLLPLAVFIAWPMFRRPSKSLAQGEIGGGDVAAQATLYKEHLVEIDASRDSGAIDEAQYESLKAELGRKLLAEDGDSYQLAAEHAGGRGLLLGLAFLVPFVAVGLYFYWGAHDDLVLYRDMVASQAGETDMVAEARITQQLQARAGTHPQDLSSRYVLAQRLLVSNDVEGAVAQYRFILAHEPEALGVRAELAQALFFVAGSQVTPEVLNEVEQVLADQPNNSTALGLAGIAAFERKDFAAARNYWQGALVQMPPGSNAAQALSAGVLRAENALAEAGGEVTKKTASAEIVADSAEVPVADKANRISVKVTLANSIQASPETPVFIYARSAGSPMPLAIVRLTAAELPAQVVLDESSAMMPGRSLKSVDQVQLVARLAVNGNARPAAGDWQGEVKTLSRSDWSSPVHIAINQEI